MLGDWVGLIDCLRCWNVTVPARDHAVAGGDVVSNLPRKERRVLERKVRESPHVQVWPGAGRLGRQRILETI